MKKTVIIGATTNPTRYAFLAASMLSEYNHEFVPVGIKTGEVFGKQIINIKEKPWIDSVGTVTLYIGPDHQPEWYDYLISLKPSRVIFNPGTENGEFQKLLHEMKIETIDACTLVMLRTDQY
jgi:uncharacterized protein